MSNRFHHPDGAPPIAAIGVTFTRTLLRDAIALRDPNADDAASIIAFETLVRAHLEAAFPEADITVELEDMGDRGRDFLVAGVRPVDGPHGVTVSPEERIAQFTIDEQLAEMDALVLVGRQMREQVAVYLREGTDWLIAPGAPLPEAPAPREHRYPRTFEAVFGDTIPMVNPDRTPPQFGEIGPTLSGDETVEVIWIDGNGLTGLRHREVGLLEQALMEGGKLGLRSPQCLDEMGLGAVLLQRLRRPLRALARIGDVQHRLLDLGEVSFVHARPPIRSRMVVAATDAPLFPRAHGACHF